MDAVERNEPQLIIIHESVDLLVLFKNLLETLKPFSFSCMLLTEPRFEISTEPYVGKKHSLTAFGVSRHQAYEMTLFLNGWLVRDAAADSEDRIAPLEAA